MFHTLVLNDISAAERWRKSTFTGSSSPYSFMKFLPISFGSAWNTLGKLSSHLGYTHAAQTTKSIDRLMPYTTSCDRCTSMISDYASGLLSSPHIDLTLCAQGECMNEV
mgnify:CR=1 FL=1